MNNKHRLIFYYSIVLFSILIYVVSTQRLLWKAGLPLTYKTVNGFLITEKDFDSIDSNSAICTVNGLNINSEFQLELILDSREVGEVVKIETSYKGVINTHELTLVPYYGNLAFIVISLLIGITFLCCALFVISKRPGMADAKLLFWVLLLFSLATVTSPGSLYQKGDYLGIAIRAFHISSFLLGIDAFLHFSLVFPRKRKYAGFLSLLIYVLFTMFIILISYTMVKSIQDLNEEWIKFYELLWSILRVVLVFSITLGIINFFIISRKLHSKSEKNKVYWILWGIAVGVLPYLVLYVVPTILKLTLIIPEEYALLPLVLVPISFAVAVAKYHIFDIELIIKRSIVYAALTGFVLALYFIVVLGLTSLIHKFAGNIDRITSLVAAVTIAVFFVPLRNKIQNFVDKTFYRERYNFEHAVNSFTKSISKCSTLGQLGLKVMDEIQHLVPVEKIALILPTDEGRRIKVLAHRNLDDVLDYIRAFRVKALRSEFNMPFALSEKVQHDIDTDASLTNVFRKWKIDIAFPLKLESDVIIGAIVLGNKLSGMRYSQNDIDLLNVISSECAFAVKRLELQEELVLKEIEKQKLEELNSLKSFFVASVSHDLKTPLSSIKMYAEILKQKKKKTARLPLKYLEIIQGESERLAKLIDNVLDLAKIEKGIKEYKFSEVDLNEIVEEASSCMSYQFKMNKFKVKTLIDKRENLILGDKDSIIEAVINILSNAIKYSPDRKEIEISTSRCADFAEVTVKDKGKGISGRNLENIFSPYFRSKESTYIKGTGIGLAIVKHIIDAHGGRIEVESKVGYGSTFKLKFALRKDEQ